MLPRRTFLHLDHFSVSPMFGPKHLPLRLAGPRTVFTIHSSFLFFLNDVPSFSRTNSPDLFLYDSFFLSPRPFLTHLTITSTTSTTHYRVTNTVVFSDFS